MTDLLILLAVSIAISAVGWKYFIYFFSIGYGYGVAGLLEMIRGLKFKKKHAAAFGSYGWSGEAVKQLSERLEQAGFAMLNEGLRMAWVPDDASLQQCRDYGRNIAQALNA